jgi:hypothetical protein
LGIYWKNVKNNGWGNKLQEFLKYGAYHASYYGSVPPMCIYNQMAAKMRLELKKKKKDGRLVVATIPIPWARNSYYSLLLVK